MTKPDEKIVYPKLLDEYFKSNPVVIKQIPEDFIIVSQESVPDKTFTRDKTNKGSIEAFPIKNYKN